MTAEKHASDCVICRNDKDAGEISIHYYLSPALEQDTTGAPSWYSNEEASAWANGHRQGLEDAARSDRASVVTAVEELDALPEGSVLRVSANERFPEGVVIEVSRSLHVHYRGFNGARYFDAWGKFMLPATVLWTPEEDTNV